jgi:hypothetical protein
MLITCSKISLPILQPSLLTISMPLNYNENFGYVVDPYRISYKFVNLFATYFFFINKISGLNIPSISI